MRLQRIRGAVRRAIPRARARHVPGSMNKTELRYEMLLRGRQAAGEILWFAFEPVKLCLGARCFFTADFGVVTADRTIELHEVKAWWTKQGHAGIEDDARVKLQAAASRYPFFRFVIAAEERAGGITREWHYEEIGVDGARSLLQARSS